MGSTDITTHGAVLCYSAVADHVAPRSRGGRTDPENLVTACYPCNFGKADYAVEQLALRDPRARPAPEWDSLERFVPALEARARAIPSLGRA
jgi:5-methylcytosine-specific restriction endonuclease McrA